MNKSARRFPAWAPFLFAALTTTFLFYDGWDGGYTLSLRLLVPLIIAHFALLYGRSSLSALIVFFPVLGVTWLFTSTKETAFTLGLPAGLYVLSWVLALLITRPATDRSHYRLTVRSGAAIAAVISLFSFGFGFEFEFSVAASARSVLYPAWTIGLLTFWLFASAHWAKRSVAAFVVMSFLFRLGVEAIISGSVGTLITLPFSYESFDDLARNYTVWNHRFSDRAGLVAIWGGGIDVFFIQMAGLLSGVLLRPILSGEEQASSISRTAQLALLIPVLGVLVPSIDFDNLWRAISTGATEDRLLTVFLFDDRLPEFFGSGGFRDGLIFFGASAAVLTSLRSSLRLWTPVVALSAIGAVTVVLFAGTSNLSDMETGQHLSLLSLALIGVVVCYGGAGWMLAKQRYGESIIGDDEPWAWSIAFAMIVPLGLSLSLPSLDITDRVAVSFQLPLFVGAPFISGWLGYRFGRRAFWPVITVCLLGTVISSLGSVRPPMSVGLGPALSLVSFATYWYFAGDARNHSEPQLLGTIIFLVCCLFAWNYCDLNAEVSDSFTSNLQLLPMEWIAAVCFVLVLNGFVRVSVAVLISLLISLGWFILFLTALGDGIYFGIDELRIVERYDIMIWLDVNLHPSTIPISVALAGLSALVVRNLTSASQSGAKHETWWIVGVMVALIAFESPLRSLWDLVENSANDAFYAVAQEVSSRQLERVVVTAQPSYDPLSFDPTVLFLATAILCFSLGRAKGFNFVVLVPVALGSAVLLGGLIDAALQYLVGEGIESIKDLTYRIPTICLTAAIMTWVGAHHCYGKHLNQDAPER